MNWAASGKERVLKAGVGVGGGVLAESSLLQPGPGLVLRAQLLLDLLLTVLIS